MWSKYSHKIPNISITRPTQVRLILSITILFLFLISGWLGYGNFRSLTLFFVTLFTISLYYPELVFFTLLAFPKNYYVETAYSLVPYLIIGLLIQISIKFFQWLTSGRKRNFSSLQIAQFCVLTLISIFWVSSYSSQTIVGKYSQNTPQPPSEYKDIRVLFANILYYNQQYSDIQTFIDNLQADIIIFAEFTDQQSKNLNFTQYPYILKRPPFESGESGSHLIIYSKYPLINSRIQRNILNTRVITRSGPLHLLGLHLTSPSNYSNFSKRNQQLQLLSYQINQQQSPQLIIGDLNTAPTSLYYYQFHQAIGNQIQPVIFKNYPYFTWESDDKLVKAHVDHAFISPDIPIKSKWILEFPGSDHKALVLDL